MHERENASIGSFVNGTTEEEDFYLLPTGQGERKNTVCTHSLGRFFTNKSPQKKKKKEMNKLRGCSETYLPEKYFITRGDLATPFLDPWSCDSSAVYEKIGIKLDIKIT